MRGVAVTTLTGLAGVLAGVASGYLVGTTPESATDPRAVFVLAALILVQFPILKAMGVDVSDFGVKDYLYIAFMTFALWFVSFAILLSSGVTL
jgi:hypothetical protein